MLFRSETVKDPKLKQKAIENMKKNFELLLEAKFKEKEEQLKNKEQQENIALDNKNADIISKTNAVKKYKLKNMARKKLAV